MSDDDTPDRLLKIDEVIERVGYCKAMIYRLIQKDKFPAPYKAFSSSSRWSEREVKAWIDDVKDGFEGKRRKFW